MVTSPHCIDSRVHIVLDSPSLYPISAFVRVTNDIARAKIRSMWITDTSEIDQGESAKICFDGRVRVSNTDEIVVSLGEQLGKLARI